MLFCAMLLGGCSAPKTEDTKAEGESTAVPQKVIALSKSNAELWLLAGGSLIGTSEDAMALAGISPETVIRRRKHWEKQRKKSAFRSSIRILTLLKTTGK